MFSTWIVRLSAQVGGRDELQVYFSDSALHDDEVGVVDVQLDRLEEGLDGCLVGLVAIDEVLCEVWHCDLLVSLVSIEWIGNKIGMSFDDQRRNAKKDSMNRKE